MVQTLKNRLAKRSRALDLFLLSKATHNCQSHEASERIHHQNPNQNGKIRYLSLSKKQRNLSKESSFHLEHLDKRNTKEQQTKKYNKNKILKNKHYYAKPKKKIQRKAVWYDLPTTLSQKSMVKYENSKTNFEEIQSKENKENYPGPGYYDVSKKSIIQTPVIKKQNRYNLKASNLISQKINDQVNENEEVTVANYNKMSSPFFKCSLNSVAFNNRQLLEKIFYKERQSQINERSEEDNSYVYLTTATPAPNQYNQKCKEKIKSSAMVSFISKTQKFQKKKEKFCPAPTTYKVNDSQHEKLTQESSFFISATERFPTIYPVCNELQYMKISTKKKKNQKKNYSDSLYIMKQQQSFYESDESFYSGLKKQKLQNILYEIEGKRQPILQRERK